MWSEALRLTESTAHASDEMCLVVGYVLYPAPDFLTLPPCMHALQSFLFAMNASCALLLLNQIITERACPTPPRARACSPRASELATLSLAPASRGMRGLCVFASTSICCYGEKLQSNGRRSLARWHDHSTLRRFPHCSLPAIALHQDALHWGAGAA